MTERIEDIIKSVLRIDDDGALLVRGRMQVGSREVPAEIDLDVTDEQAKKIKEWLGC